MAEGADTVVILSSELISEITEQYFNSKMFKRKVKIVDLRPTETGYMFSVAFQPSPSRSVLLPTIQQPFTPIGSSVRDKNGKFSKVSAREE